MVEAREVLEQVKAGNISIEEAEKYFRKKPFEELGYAKLDTHRQVRSGFPEVVFCSGKPDEYLVSIYQKLFEANGVWNQSREEAVRTGKGGYSTGNL